MFDKCLAGFRDSGLPAKRGERVRVSLVVAALVTLVTACQSSSTPTPPAQPSPPTTSGGPVTSQGVATPAAPTVETGAATSVVPVGKTARGVVALFADGQAYFSPDGENLGGGGASVSAASAGSSIVAIAAASGGVVALLQDGTALFSPDGLNLRGGGSTVVTHAGNRDPITSIVSVGGGVDVVLASGGAYFSLNGGVSANATVLYLGTPRLLQIVPVGPGDAVVARFEDSTVRYSAANRDLAAAPEVSAVLGGAGAIVNLVRTPGGLFSQGADRHVHFTPYGAALSAGASTTEVSSWQRAADGTFGPRDSARGADFAGHLWLSGGFHGNLDGSPGCSADCSYYDLWSSVDLSGSAWNPTSTAHTSATPDPRDVPPGDFFDAYSALLVWKQSLWAIGSTVWNSSDGTHWTRLNQADGTPLPGPIAFTATEDSRAVTLGSSIIFVQTDTGEVLRTSDLGSGNWDFLGAIPGFKPRCGAAVFSAQGRVWIEGGGACDYSSVYTDIWSSADGATWTRSASTAAWPARMWPCVAVDESGTSWLATGFAPTDWDNTGATTPRYAKNFADVWYSSDGETWQQYKADAGSGLPDDGLMEPRHSPTCYIETINAAKTLIVVAGKGGLAPDNNYANILSSVRTLQLP